MVTIKQNPDLILGYLTKLPIPAKSSPLHCMEPHCPLGGKPLVPGVAPLKKHLTDECVPG